MTKVGEHITLDIIGTTQEYDPSVYENGSTYFEFYNPY